ncbi:DinB family protein [Amycolatopsis sp. NBC_00355]
MQVLVRGLTDEDAAKRTTVSELTLGGLLRHPWTAPPPPPS